MPVDTQQNQNKQIILGDVLHIIATTPKTKDGILPVLEAVQSALGASGGGYLVFEEPHLLVTTGLGDKLKTSLETWQAFVAGLKPGIHLDPALYDSDLPVTSWVASKIISQGNSVGVIWLVFDETPQFNDDNRVMLDVWLNGLTVLTTNLRVSAQHQKVVRNQNEFMRIVSHDLRSPLTSIQGFASMLESNMVGELNEKQAHFVQKILAGIVQMTSLVDNIQDAGRYDPETGFYEMQRDHCDLAEIVQRIVRNHLLPAEKQELTLTAVISDDVPIIYADANMLERAITNLVDNAIKYSPNGRDVEVSVRRADDDIVVSVKDNGLGISKDHQKALFERHVRIPRKEHKRVKGSGLGLFIVRSVARRHGGDAWVESEEGVGSTFSISIPLSKENSIFRD